MLRFPGKIRGQRVSPANFPGKRSIIWLIQTKRVATLAVCRNKWHTLADSDETRCNACRLQKQCVSANGRRCNPFRLKKPDDATFSREIRGRNALQRVSPAEFPGKRSMIWFL